MTNVYTASEKQVSYLEALLRDRDCDEAPEMIDALRKGIDSKMASDFIGKLLRCPRIDNAPLQRNGRDSVQGITEDGMYIMPNGDIYKVQFNRAQGDGRRLYAKLLVLTEHADGWHVRFDYAKGAVQRLTPAMKMTFEQAKEFGALYGTCCNCGRTLTNEESIELGIGPVCRGKFAL